MTDLQTLANLAEVFGTVTIIGGSTGTIVQATLLSHYDLDGSGASTASPSARPAASSNSVRRRRWNS